MNRPDPAERPSDKQIFFEALELSTPEERAAFLQGACGNDWNQRSRVEELLAEHFEHNDFMAAPALDAAVSSRWSAKARAALPGESPAQRVGRYKLLEKIGEGGFGEVWMAEQREPVKRRVALKIIKPGMDSRQVIARFEAERQALALMDHPNIARILDAGTTGEGAIPQAAKASAPPVAAGRPYFVMELVRGLKITEFCDQNQLATQDRIQIFIQVCHAVQHAHQKGIIHRDLKPSNILVTLHDGAPVPKVIDFGIAKAMQQELTDKTVFTQFSQFIGTPAYISPEQAETSDLDIDTRSDIYSLGVLLYELLVGRPPFDPAEMIKGGLDSLRQVIRELEPPKPSTRLKRLPVAELTTAAQRRRTEPIKLTDQVQGDLDWIVLKCLEKDRARRYETVSGLAADLQRYLDNEPILARPPSLGYRLLKFVQRQRLAVTSGILVVLALAIGISTALWVQFRANQDYRDRLYLSEVNRAGLAWQAGQLDKQRDLLDRCPVDRRRWEWQFLHEQLDRWTATPLLAVTNLVSAALSHDGRLRVVTDKERTRVQDNSTGRTLAIIPFGAEWRSPAAVSPREDLLATLDHASGVLTIWNLRSGAAVATTNHGSPSQTFAWSSDGRWIATGGEDKIIRIWAATNAHLVRSLPAPAAVHGLGFSPDNTAIAVGTTDAQAQLVDVQTGSIRRRFRTKGGHVHALIFSPDGQKIVIANRTFGGFQRDYRVWSVDGDEGSMDLHVGDALTPAFSHDSQQLWAGDGSGTVHRWDLNRRVEIERFSAHLGPVLSLQHLATGELLTTGQDGAVRLWRARQPGAIALEGYDRSLRTLAFTKDGRWLIAAGLSENVIRWEMPGNHGFTAYSRHKSPAGAVAATPDGLVATADNSNAILLWDPLSMATRWQAQLPGLTAYWIAASPDGRRIYGASRAETLTALDAATGKQIQSVSGIEGIIDGLAISPDSRWLAIGQKLKLSVWDAAKLQRQWEVPSTTERCVAFSPDGRWLASGDKDGSIRLWEVESAGRNWRQLSGHSGSVSGVAFHPTEERLVSCGFDGLVKVWDWRSGNELLTLPAPGGGILWHALFSPDGKRIAAAGGEGIVWLWQVE